MMAILLYLIFSNAYLLCVWKFSHNMSDGQYTNWKQLIVITCVNIVISIGYISAVHIISQYR